MTKVCLYNVSFDTIRFEKKKYIKENCEKSEEHSGYTSFYEKIAS